MFEGLFKVWARLILFFRLSLIRNRSPNSKSISRSESGSAAATTGDNSPINIINNTTPEAPGRGGNGGSPTIVGSGIAIGGSGGAGGQYGRGGDGGGGVHTGKNVFAIGGEGGEAGQFDRGGKGGRSPLEILEVPNQQLPDGTWLWDRGRGGDGAFLPNSDKTPS